MAASRAFGVAYKVDDVTFEEYMEHGLDLEIASGETHHQLPVPSVFITGTDGLIRFVHSDPDYTVRLDPAVLLDAASNALSDPDHAGLD
jgi:hypothetical protein